MVHSLRATPRRRSCPRRTSCCLARAPPMHPEDLPFPVIRVNSDDEVIACANNLLVGRAAYETAVRLYPRDTIQYSDGARIIARSEPQAS
jgi:hypothetical protein